jgi:DnaJ family protein A protein 5
MASFNSESILPDKNPENTEECTKVFREIQAAYEVLIDPQERAWYDKNRDKILMGVGSNFKDNSIDLMPYFTPTVYNGFGDDDQGFYSVYREVFEKVAAEDSQYMEQDDEPMPTFGNSQSDYEEVVRPFYGYWQSYSTAKPFFWEDKYDVRDAPNRKVQRLLEKDNKKLRDAAKKQRNEVVRVSQHLFCMFYASSIPFSIYVYVCISY